MREKWKKRKNKGSSVKNIYQPIKDIMKHYAVELGDDNVLSVLDKESIDSESEAKNILVFLDSMCNRIAIDAKKNVVILHQPVHTTDAEKICDIIEDHIEDLGYGHLLE